MTTLLTCGKAAIAFISSRDFRGLDSPITTMSGTDNDCTSARKSDCSRTASRLPVTKAAEANRAPGC